MNKLISGALLGLVQGLTEFLPVSSSGHLAILQHYLRFPGDRLFFDVMLHFATLLSVLVYFRRRIVEYLRSPRILSYIVLVTIPTGVVGLLLKEKVEVLIRAPKIIAIMLLITAFITFLVDKIEGTKKIEELGSTGALFVGVFQGLAVIPGISRSGSTIFASVIAGVDKEEAAPFSFIVSIPAIAGATLLETLKLGNHTAQLDAATLVGMTVAFATGLAAIKIFVETLRTRRFRLFSAYLIAAALAVLLAG